LERIGRRENLVVCGPSGTGKTFLFEALGQAAVDPACASPGSPWRTSACWSADTVADGAVTKAIRPREEPDGVDDDEVGAQRPGASLKRSSCPPRRADAQRCYALPAAALVMGPAGQ
jgi:septin family protein